MTKRQMQAAVERIGTAAHKASVLAYDDQLPAAVRGDCERAMRLLLDAQRHMRCEVEAP